MTVILYSEGGGAREERGVSSTCFCVVSKSPKTACMSRVVAIKKNMIIIESL